MPVVINGTSGITDVDGTASAPALTGTDTDTGIFFPAANTIAWSTGGTERVRVDSSGNVGIGTSSPSTYVANGGLALFNYYGTSSTALAISNNSAFSASNIARIDFRVNNSFSGNERIAAIWGINPNAGANNGGALVFGVSANGTATTPSEVARITSDGRLLVGKTSAGDFVTGVEMQPAGAVLAYRSSAVAGIFGRTDNGETVRFTNNGNTVGTISTTGSATAYNTSSDYRLKEDIAPMTGALERVAALKPVTYTWKSTGESDEGFIAHELAEVCPSAVTGEKDAVDADGNPVYQGIDTSFLVATLTAAIQELKAELDATKAEVAALKGQ